jgi:hypothetical protein
LSDYEFDEYDDDEYGGRRGRPRKKKTGWMLAGLLGGGLVILLCCGGGSALVIFGMNMMTREIEVELRDNEVLVEQLGPLESFEINWTASLGADDDVYVFDAQGSNASGEVTVKSLTGLDDKEEIIWAKLRLHNGEVVDLVEEN